MSKIELQLNAEDLAASVQHILAHSRNTLIRNPLPAIVAECVTNNADLIRSTVDKVTREFLGSAEFAQRIRQVYRDAMLGEAARMGRNAARAAVNAKEVQS